MNFKGYLRKTARFISLGKIRVIIGFLNHYFIGLFKRIDEHHVFLFGGGLAFSVFVCIIPIVLILFFLLGTFLQTSSIEIQLNDFINAIIPYPTYAEEIKKIIISRIDEVIKYRTIAGYVGGFGLLLAASGLFSSMRTVLNRIFGIIADKPVLIGKLRDFGMVILLILLIPLITLVLPVLTVLIKSAQDIPLLYIFRLTYFENLLFYFLSSSLIFILFFIFYYTIPYAKLGSKIPAVSAFWATILWVAAKELFGYYLTAIASFNRIYGTYAFLVVVAFWIYYSSVLFIIGAEIGQLYKERAFVSITGEKN